MSDNDALFPIQNYNRETGTLEFVHADESITDAAGRPILSDSEKIDLILEKIVKTEAMVAKIIEEVKPTIDELMNSQLFKMIGMGKKK